MSPISISPIARLTLVAAVLLASACFVSGQERVPFFDEDTKLPKTTRSPDGNFVVHGSDAHTRGVYSEFAVKSFSDFRTLTNARGRLKDPVVITLIPVPGNRYAGHPVQLRPVISPQYSPNLHIRLCESLRMAQVREYLVWHFLMDDALRRSSNPGEIVEKRGKNMIPSWLWAGVSEAIEFQQTGEPSELFSAVFESGQLMSVAEILRTDPSRLTSLSRAIYRASAGGLVLTLMQQKNGAAQMRRYVDDLAGALPDQEAMLQKHFPGIDDSNNSLEKWWALKVAELAKPTSLDIFSIKETEDRLQRALVVAVMENQRSGGTPAEEEAGRRPLMRIFKKRDRTVPDTDEVVGVAPPVIEQRVTYDLSDYKSFAGRADLAEILHQNELWLMQLSYRSFPLHRPLIKEYLQIIVDLGKGDTKRLDERFDRLATTRQGLLRSGQMAEDVMNLYDATEADHSSGEFEEYFKLFDHLRRAKPERNDEISKYLDRIQAEAE